MQQRPFLLATCLVLTCTLFAACRSAGSPAPGQSSFDDPRQALETLVQAVRADDLGGLALVLGPEADELIDSGDPIDDRAARAQFLAALDEGWTLEGDAGGPVVLYVGEDEWPFPVPLERGGDGWFFDTEEGLDELLARRIGGNELNTIESCQAFVDAQLEYASVDRDGDGLLEYAQRFGSSEGQRDGLYWPTEEDEPPSPLGPLVSAAAGEGYDFERDAAKPQPYQGYLFRILDGQGDCALGEGYEYVVRGSMVGGCALVAWPAEYGSSGVMTFLVNHEGVVFEKDLGDDTASLAAAMKCFAPDESWGRVEP